VDWLSGAVRAVGALVGQPALMSADLRMHNFAVFGVALLLATLPRARRTTRGTATVEQPAPSPAYSIPR
jgi:hypothetical protein